MSYTDTPKLNDGNEFCVAPDSMREDWYVNKHTDMYEDYVEMRLTGVHPSIAFRRIWGEGYWDQMSQSRIYAIEESNFYRKEFAIRLAATPIEKLWDLKKSVHNLVCLSQNPFAKDNTRLGAMKELNVLVGITMIDENGKTVAGKGMREVQDALYDSVPETKREVPARPQKGNKAAPQQ